MGLRTDAAVQTSPSGIAQYQEYIAAPWTGDDQARANVVLIGDHVATQNQLNDSIITDPRDSIQVSDDAIPVVSNEGDAEDDTQGNEGNPSQALKISREMGEQVASSSSSL